MAGTFDLLEHTADLGIVATDDTLEEVLAWAAKGWFSVIADLDTGSSRGSLIQYQIRHQPRRPPAGYRPHRGTGSSPAASPGGDQGIDLGYGPS
jgi:hypothetical protein